MTMAKTTHLPSPADLIVVGASVRSACQSAIRSGYNPIGIDLFGDIDLAEACQAIRIEDYPAEICSALENLESSIPWMYTGGIENYPDLIEEVSNRRDLIGNTGSVISRIRDPFWISNVLADANLPSLRVARCEDLAPGNNWLIKRLRGAAGHGIQRLDLGEPLLADSGESYLQQFVEGPSFSAVYLALPDEVVFVGLSQQLVGESFLNAGEFEYCGSIGPIGNEAPELHGKLNQDTIELVKSCGRVLERTANLRVLFGIALVVADGIPFVVEVNPRYTASVEVFERSLSLPLVAWHVQACTKVDSLDPAMLKAAIDKRYASPHLLTGKGIFFSPCDLTIGDLHSGSLEDSIIADIPYPKTSIANGSPICTFIVTGDSLESSRGLLCRAAAQLERYASDCDR